MKVVEKNLKAPQYLNISKVLRVTNDIAKHWKRKMYKLIRFLELIVVVKKLLNDQCQWKKTLDGAHCKSKRVFEYALSIKRGQTKLESY